jgi:hypothetical protein
MKLFRRFRADRFPLTTLQNPNLEVRTYAELVQAAQQERENQSAPAPIPAEIPATQPPPAPAVPCAADSIPAALDSANPDLADPDSRIEAVRQLAASLGIPVIVETSTLPAVEAAPATQLARKPRPKSKSHRKSRGTGNPACPEGTRRACASSVTSTETEALDEDDSGLSAIERHSRKCSICRHPERQSIDEAFLHWRSPHTIMHCFGILSETTIYRHAHAFDFFALRNRNLQSALGNVIEEIDKRVFTGTEMLNAVRALAQLNEDGRWISPTSKSEIVYSMQRLPAVAGPPAPQACVPAVTRSEPILIGSRPLLENGAND